MVYNYEGTKKFLILKNRFFKQNKLGLLLNKFEFYLNAFN